MSIQFSIREMLDAVGVTYRTIDFRSAAVKQGNKWINVYAVARMTYEEPEAALKRLHNLERDHGTVHGESFRIFLDHCPFTKRDLFFQHLEQGKLFFGGTEVLLAQPPTLTDQRVYIRKDYSGIRNFDSLLWPVANYPFFQHNTTPLLEDAVAREAAKFHYSNGQEAVNLLCELNVQVGSSNGYHFWLSLPVFAAITEVRASLREKRIVTTILKQRDIPSLSGTVISRRQRVFVGEPPKHRLSIDRFSDIGGNTTLRQASAAVRLIKTTEHDAVEVRLSCAGLGEIDSSYEHALRNLVPPAERNILFEALKFFCPETELRQLLCEPHETEPKKLNPSAAFELHLAWLLGMFGLSTAVLGQYEKIFARKTRVERGSIDVLAASQPRKILVVVACTLNAPEEADFSNLVNSAGILLREVYNGTTVSILPLICTGISGYSSFKENSNGLGGVPVLDADRLRILLNLLATGRERDFFQFLESPNHSDLRE